MFTNLFAGLGTWLVALLFTAVIVGGAYVYEWWADRRDRLRDCPCPMCREPRP